MPAAFVLLNCTENNEKDVISRLKKIHQVTETQCITGPYDVLIKVESSTLEDLNETITWKIRKIKNVRSTYILKINEEATDCKDDK